MEKAIIVTVETSNNNATMTLRFASLKDAMDFVQQHATQYDHLTTSKDIEPTEDLYAELYGYSTAVNDGGIVASHYTVRTVSSEKGSEEYERNLDLKEVEYNTSTSTEVEELFSSTFIF